MKQVVTICVVLLMGIHLQAQIKVGFEFQAYPTGLIPGIQFEKTINEKSSVHLRLGYNWIRHRDLGVHDDERGDGYGFSLGVMQNVPKIHDKLRLGLRNDVWWNTIDWMDDPSASGTTDITVIQPTAILDYKLVSKQFTLRPSLAFGYEWNVKTEGAPTGEGAILLLGFLLSSS